MLKLAGKKTSASSQLARLMESPLPLPTPGENPQHKTTGPPAEKQGVIVQGQAPQPSRLPVPPTFSGPEATTVSTGV